MQAPTSFQPHPPLIDTAPHPSCRAIVVIPARNEEQCLPLALDALRLQVDGFGNPLSFVLFEVIVLLNNCTDSSASVVRAYQARYPAFRLHAVERLLPARAAHVGTARRMLMDTAFHRLQPLANRCTAILSTDADSVVARDWIWINLSAIESGADVVGGAIHLKPEDLDHLDPRVLLAYQRDRTYQARVAQLESLLDPDPADPWPRHLQHFGASLACTPHIYRRAGGLPPIKPLEDVAFIQALRRIGARIRHAPHVSIATSARLHGRSEVGLSGQLRHWQQDAIDSRPHHVQNAAYLTHRFRTLARLRAAWAASAPLDLVFFPRAWHASIRRAHQQALAQSDFLAAIDSERLICESFRGPTQGPIQAVIADLEHAISSATPQPTPAPAHPAETAPVAAT